MKTSINRVGLGKLGSKTAITGAGGFVGSLLAQKKSTAPWNRVNALDLFIYGEDVLISGNKHFKHFNNVNKIKGDIRNKEDLKKAFKDVETVFHLACISNDPSFELNPDLGRSINCDAFDAILNVLEECPSVKRFIYASSSSVYGISDSPQVTEDTPKNPLTDYSKFKLECEDKLINWKNPNDIIWTILRPATVCGYSPRLRLDLVVNILTASALINDKITVMGGDQIRSNVHIEDMVNSYLFIARSKRELVHKEIFNVGLENHTVLQLAELVKTTLEQAPEWKSKKKSIKIDIVKSDDNRSYHINSDKIQKIGFKFKKTIKDAILDLMRAYLDGKIIDGLKNPLYHNVKMMKDIKLT